MNCFLYKHIERGTYGTLSEKKRTNERKKERKKETTTTTLEHECLVVIFFRSSNSPVYYKRSSSSEAGTSIANMKQKRDKILMLVSNNFACALSFCTCSLSKTIPCKIDYIIRDALLNFQVVEKELFRKKKAHEDEEKKNHPRRKRKKNHPCLQGKLFFEIFRKKIILVKATDGKFRLH